MKNLFNSDFDISRIIQGLKIESGVNITPNDTLIIFDEVQEVPNALTSLKYFCENVPEYSIIAAGLLLGVALHQNTSFPVGKVDFMDLYPLNFNEFLIALNQKDLSDLIISNDFPLIATFKDKIVTYLRKYYYVGGMPAAVMSYCENENLNEVRTIQLRLLDSYEQDFSKHAPISIVPRIRQLFNNIPTQLAKENKKFIYGLIKEGARAKEYELALEWLIDCGLVYKINRARKPDIPLIAYQDFSAFKLYVLDVDILGAMTRLSPKILLEGNNIFEEFKGSFTKEFVLQELKSNSNIPIFYWTSEKSSNEVDYVIQISEDCIPIEVKAETNLKAKSLKAFIDKYKTKINVRTSMQDYIRQENLVNIPLYCIGNIQNILNI